MLRSNRSTSVLFAVLVLATTATEANAYMDGGTGSLLIQMLIAGVLGAIFTVKTKWAMLKASLRRDKPSSLAKGDER